MKKTLISAVLTTMLVGGAMAAEAAFENKTFSGNGTDTLAAGSYNIVTLNNTDGTTHIVNAGAPGGTLSDSQLTINELQVTGGKGIMNFYLDNAQTLAGMTNQIQTSGYVNVGGTSALVNSRVSNVKNMELTGGAVAFIGGFDNSGTLRIATDAQALICNHTSNTFATIDNGVSGNVSVQGYAVIQGYGDISHMPYENVAIENEGVMNVGTEVGSVVYIDGTVRNVGTNAKTHIVLNKYNNHFMGVFTGKIENSNVGEFSLTVNEGAYWCPYNQTEEVYGVTLNSGNVSLTGTLGSYQTLKLHNLNATGVPTFTFWTNLLADEGDTMILNGTTPNVKFNVNVTDQNVLTYNSIKKEDGHKVVLITAPDDTQMKLNKALALCDYDGGTKILKATIEDEVGDGIKTWSLVGWEPAGDAVPKEELVNEIEPALVVQDSQNTLKRINDIRNDPGEVGVWLRGEKGESKIHNYEYEFNIMSGGYDWDKENDARHLFYGFGFTYSVNKCDDGVIGDSKGRGINLYMSYLGKEKHDFFDVIAKYGKINKEYSGIDYNGDYASGDYDKNVYSLTLKYGRRYETYKGYYVEPYGSFMYAHIGGADYINHTSYGDYNVRAESVKSLIGSLGVQVGTNVRGTDYYGRVEYMHDFDGKMDAYAPGVHAHDDMGGGWVKTAIGVSRRAGKHSNYYLELGKDFGSKVKKPYSVAVGFRYMW